MDEKYSAILGGLIGSSFTIVVTKILEYFQTKQEHRLVLKKEYFLRKLNVFEKTVSCLTIVHTSITNMAVLLKIGLNENVIFTEQQGKDIFNKLEMSIQKVYDVTLETAGSIDLYVDLKHADKEVEDAQLFWELLGTINQLNYEITYGYELLRAAITQADYQKLEMSIGLSIKKLERNIESLLLLSNSTRSRYLEIASLLRAELKKYE